MGRSHVAWDRTITLHLCWELALVARGRCCRSRVDEMVNVREEWCWHRLQQIVDQSFHRPGSPLTTLETTVSNKPHDHCLVPDQSLHCRNPTTESCLQNMAFSLYEQIRSIYTRSKDKNSSQASLVPRWRTSYNWRVPLRISATSTCFLSNVRQLRGCRHQRADFQFSWFRGSLGSSMWLGTAWVSVLNGPLEALQNEVQRDGIFGVRSTNFWVTSLVRPSRTKPTTNSKVAVKPKGYPKCSVEQLREVLIRLLEF